MPRMTGLEMIEKLRSARMAIPVIMAQESLPWMNLPKAMVKTRRHAAEAVFQ